MSASGQRPLCAFDDVGYDCHAPADVVVEQVDVDDDPEPVCLSHLAYLRVAVQSAEYRERARLDVPEPMRPPVLEEEHDASL